MKLVDFRFMQRPFTVNDTTEFRRYLQVRHKELRIEPVDGTVHLVFHDCKESYQWGQWEDVPCVGAGD
jgi:hypothetical protein